MNYFLAKTEPSTYSIEDFAKEKQTTWNGIKNPQAVQALKAMNKGDKVFIYHSGGKGEIRGLAVVIGNSKPDIKEEKSWLVDFKLEKIYKEPFITLKQIKASGLFNDIALVRQGRLSTMEVPEKFVKWLSKQGLSI